VLHQVGAGTLGPVFRAHDPAEGRLVAIKAFRLDLPPPRAAEFARALDALAARSLDHPSIATPLAAGIEGSTAWFAQAYVPAESLDVALRQYGPPPLADTLAIVTQLAGALDFAAAAGVLHGALHPRDILVAPDDTRVVDLGVAAALEQVGLRATMRRPYSAPERIAGGPVTRAADVFALGAITFELVTGTRVMGAGDEAVAALPEISGANREALSDTFAFALSSAPDERFTTALGFVGALKRALGDAPARHVVSAAAPVPVPVAVPVAAAEPPVPATEQSAPLEEEATPPRATTGTQAPSEATPIMVPPAPAPVSHGTLDDVAFRPAPHEEPAEWDVHPEARTPPPFEPPFAAVAAASKTRSQGGARTPIWKLVAAVFIVGTVAGMALGWMFFGPTSPASDQAAAVERPADPVAGASVSPPAAPTPTAEVAEQRAEPPPSQVTGPSQSASRPAAPPAHQPDAAGAVAPAPKPKPRPVPPRGQIVVRSNPAGARVELNGRDRGRTPLTIRDLPLGANTLRVTRDGYGAEQRRVTLTASRASQTVDVPLTKTTARPASSARASAARASSEFVGTVFVETRPAGAQVFIDGKLVGTSPVDVPGVSAGSHAVRLDLRGYKRWSASVTVVAGERHRVAARLEEEEIR
jgi:serine/threonine-protein kinase